jgi:hypothetical protein
LRVVVTFAPPREGLALPMFRKGFAMTQALNPTSILSIATAFWASKVLLSAVELDLFTRLGDRALTGAELTSELGLHARANPDFFDALAALGFLAARRRRGPEARYANTAEDGVLLEQAQPRYLAASSRCSTPACTVSGAT